jgi:protein required for attachment to host cells
MSTSWIVVADSNRCRLFSQTPRHGPLEELPGLKRRPLKNQDINADRPGRAFDSAGVGRHAMSPAVDPAEQETVRFAKEIADLLDTARKQHRFERLYLLAETRFLGHLRSAFGEALRETVEAEIRKDLVHESPAALNERLRQL